ncbi:hypothetical protein COS31_00255 [Candidatus Roizmanbacteria bacterium CG02_land_8_20_14_3_00_36_15]|uniref:Uncharacterized protein n=2 Tax=Candidatus Roizmaniibacteriota TaxID=1752723 RepID=A0A2M8KK15_9BACT|nr:MAG: hypothetical protein COS51_04805 [Candidatus Roizmanbacteria bacterium CG03_land_8_20_14_0_80_36_21]PIV38296.1 MAG: hypothetical protein COS31_00255 [Candidatus Roizmanbacteria bacterium CG02_land_8_20_14_3_00_36_15]PIY69824.1 MAG: hypothetical protein COY89_04415 [Candidatus Roizmanbacteria bacterium CG_4_10_14_0_8_um_filter_36_36]PJA53449.1 MAG: hypothetical protein CO166_01865 [Candidatus Roizmanbacteria bacterium CG_4_9_14_3_um_filter_36_11]PJC81451.1 MAG: hypothetical protein CO007
MSGGLLERAAQSRKTVTMALKAETPLKLKLSPKDAACFLGIPAAVLERTQLSSLIASEKTRRGSVIHFLAADSEQIALAAIQNWAQDTDPASSAHFQLTSYRYLYRLIQAVSKGIGQREMAGVTGLWLKALEQNEPDIFAGVFDAVAAHGGLDEETVEQIHQYLIHLWDQIPQELRDKNVYPPDKLFS